MSDFIKTYVLPQDFVKGAKVFSESCKTDLYTTRGQTDAEKRKFDSYVGKLGEFGAWLYAEEMGIQLDQPDCSIWEDAYKHFGYDMYNKNFNIHVKSQAISQSTKFGTSWVFEKTDRCIFGDYLDVSKDYVILTTVDPDHNIVIVYGMLAISELHSLNLFKPLVKKSLTTKLAVYWDDVERLINNAS